MTELPSRPRETYRPDIDGLRTLAILPVVCFHAGCGFPGGFVGVDVFFVISGYLITNVIQHEVDQGKFSLVAFWERRVRRLFPALALIVAATIAAGYVLLLPADFRELGQSVVAQALCAANFYFWRESGYFAATSETKPLLHLWSLAVEEQFYLLLPPLLMRRWKRRTQLQVLFALLIASFAWSVYSSPRFPAAAFFLLPTRAWELLIGVLLAQYRDRWPLSRPVAEICGTLGLAMIAAASFGFSDSTTFPGFAALLPCAGTAAIVASGGRKPGTLVQRLLSTRPFVVIGLLSYSLYLWHWPVFAFANYLKFEPLSLNLRFVLIGLSVLAAAFSWAFVEQPIRRRTVCKSRRAIFVAAGVGVPALAAAGVLIHLSNGLRSRLPSEVLQAADAQFATNPQRRLRNDLPLSRLQNELPRLGDLDDRRPPVLAVFGDSHGDALMPVVDRMCRELSIPAVAATRAATIPLFCEQSEANLQKRAFQDIVRRYLQTSDSIQHVLLVARWSNHTPAVMNQKNLERTVTELVHSGKTVWFLRQVPEQKTSMPRALALSKLWNRDPSPAISTLNDYRQRRSGQDALLEDLAGEHVRVLDPLPVFYPDGEVCRVTADGRPFYVDDDHLSVFGAMELKGVLMPLFDAILAER